VGTLQYMSPEQIDARALDGRSDLYCLGLIFYELLAGEPPFRSPSPRELLNLHCTAAPPPLRDEVRRGLPKGLEALLFQLLEKSPQARPASANEVLGRLEPFLPAVSSVAAAPAAALALPSASMMTGPPYDPTLPSPRPEGAPPGTGYPSAGPGHGPGYPPAAGHGPGGPGYPAAGHGPGGPGYPAAGGQAPGAPGYPVTVPDYPGAVRPSAAPRADALGPATPGRPSAAGGVASGAARAPSNDTLALLDPIERKPREAPKGLALAIIVTLSLLAGGVGYWLRASAEPPPENQTFGRPVGLAP
jgi:serine/threonine-protein kinase